MNGAWSRRKGVEFERAVRRRLAEVFGDDFVRRGVAGRGGDGDVIAPGVWIECKAQRRTNPRAALRQAGPGARRERRWPVAVCKDNGQPPHVMMSFEDFLALLREWHQLRIQSR